MNTRKPAAQSAGSRLAINAELTGHQYFAVMHCWVEQATTFGRIPEDSRPAPLGAGDGRRVGRGRHHRRRGYKENRAGNCGNSDLTCEAQIDAFDVIQRHASGSASRSAGALGASRLDAPVMIAIRSRIGHVFSRL
ncbi:MULTISPECIES: hypothetical protein [unclassified Bradyrhizobium]|uniref:hypothetical protein n=1 Tax=unclassified Bradyrhizobium TaxID=2631580 RepID=UPI0029170AC7|nr:MULTISPECIES: hypothetical protein [unclassified Bradyrhizobium]